MTSTSRPRASSRLAIEGSANSSSRMRGAAARSALDSNSGTTSSWSDPSGTAKRASACTATTSPGERVKLMTYRRQDSGPYRDWISAIARRVSTTSAASSDEGAAPSGQPSRAIRSSVARSAALVRPDCASPPSSSATTRAWTSECCRTSSDARWNPNVSTCHRRCWSSPKAARGTPAASSDAWTFATSPNSTSAASYPPASRRHLPAPRSAPGPAPPSDERAGRRRSRPHIVRPERAVELPIEQRDGAEDRLVERDHGRANLVERSRPPAPDLVGAPQERDLLEQPAFDVRPSRAALTGLLQCRQEAGDPPERVDHRAAARLRRMSRHHRADCQPVDLAPERVV